MTWWTREREEFTGYVRAALGDRVRITVDAEQWPMAPGRYGRLEWRGREWDTGEARLYAYTDHRAMIPRLRRAGAHPKQIGDEEAAFWVAADDHATVRAVAALLRLRQRRASGTADHLAVHAKAPMGPTKAPRKSTIGPAPA